MRLGDRGFELNNIAEKIDEAAWIEGAYII